MPRNSVARQLPRSPYDPSVTDETVRSNKQVARDRENARMKNDNNYRRPEVQIFRVLDNCNRGAGLCTRMGTTLLNRLNTEAAIEASVQPARVFCRYSLNVE